MSLSEFYFLLVKKNRQTLLRYLKTIALLGVIFSLFSHTAYANKLIAYDFNEGTGTKIINHGASGLDNFDGTLKGTTSFAADDRTGNGTVLALNGVDDYLLMPDGLAFNRALTLETWIKPDVIDGERALWHDYSYFNHPGVAFTMKDGVLSFALTVIAIKADNTIEYLDLNVTGGTLCAGKWQHIAAIYDGSSMKIFVNGIETANLATKNYDIFWGNGGDPALGYDVGNASRLKFKGKVDDFQIWDQALAANQLGDSHANTGLSCGNTKPIADAGDKHKYVSANQYFTLDGRNSYDPDNAPEVLRYAWRQIAGDAQLSFVFNDPNSATPELNANKVGTYIVELIVNDGEADSLPDTVTIEVMPENVYNRCTASCQLSAEDEGCRLARGACLFGCLVRYGTEQPLLRSAAKPIFDLNEYRQTYKQVVDQILSTNPDGQRYLQLFEHYTPELLQIATDNPKLVEEIFGSLQRFQPMMKALVEGKGAEIIIAYGDIKRVDEILTQLADLGSPDLRQTINNERQRLGNLNDFVGKSLIDAQSKVLGHGVFLPRLSNP